MRLVVHMTRSKKTEVKLPSTLNGFIHLSPSTDALVSRRQTTIQVNFVDLYGSRVYVGCPRFSLLVESR